MSHNVPRHSKDCTPLPTHYVTARDVLAFRDEAFVKYHTSPSYLDMVQRRFGAATVADIRKMTSHTLERDLLTGKSDVPPVLLPRPKIRLVG